jgi:hypothetical protein
LPDQDVYVQTLRESLEEFRGSEHVLTQFEKVVVLAGFDGGGSQASGAGCSHSQRSAETLDSEQQAVGVRRGDRVKKRRDLDAEDATAPSKPKPAVDGAAPNKPKLAASVPKKRRAYDAMPDPERHCVFSTRDDCPCMNLHGCMCTGYAKRFEIVPKPDNNHDIVVKFNLLKLVEKVASLALPVPLQR